jgi:cytochrome c551/c552
MYKNLMIIISLPILTMALGVSINNYRSDNPEPGPQIHGMELATAQQMLLFSTGDNCMNCHNNLVSPSGEDISFGSNWRASMMANSARDPYWHAAVRREVMDHPESRAAIENECSTCHMPMAHTQAKAMGEMSRVFANLPANQAISQQNILAVDGVSCTTCHQIQPDNFGEHESFVGGFIIDTEKPMGQREIYGPYPVDQGRSKIMHSSSGFMQIESKHLIESEMCATCHTLYTHTLGPGGEVIGELPEQVPYLEWKHSSFVNDQSCQSCHMPEVDRSTPISNVWGQPRENVSKHTFRGGNFFMQSMLNRYRDELGVQALPQEMDAAINRTINHLQTKSAYISINNTEVVGDELVVDVDIENLAGHKLPTAYPSRRTWIHFTVTDQNDNVVFESGAVQPNGSIAGNDNDLDASSYEQHYSEITAEDQVQIYEAILADPEGEVTTGLLTAIRYIKDNRILPKGFDKTTANEDIATYGSADRDDNFIGGGDQVRYRVNIEGSEGPLQVIAELYYQPIAYRWAQNLDSYKAAETNRFVGYYNSMSEFSSVVLTSTKISINN